MNTVKTYWLGWALIAALVAGLLPDYLGKCKDMVQSYACIIQSNAVRDHESQIWLDQRVQWHVDLIRADGVTVYDHRHLCGGQQ